MNSVRFRELKPYTSGQIAEWLGVEHSQAKTIIGNLLARGIMKRCGAADDCMPDDEDAAVSDALWQFCYVGIVVVAGVVMTVYPKYFCDREPSDEEISQILRAIRSLPQTMPIATYSGDEEHAGNQLSLMLELLNRYGEYGIYENYIDARELNGRGVIDWNRTINARLPLLAEGAPVYVEYDSRKTKRDDSDFITRLHRAVLTECSQRLEAWGVRDMLSIEEVWLSDENVDAFGDIDVLAWKLESERSIQFVTWKQGVLDLLECYLFKRNTNIEFTDVECLGTTSFYHMWELACKAAFGDRLNTKLCSLGLCLQDAWIDDKNKKLIDIIPRPKWKYVDVSGNLASCNDVDTLIPDAITLRSRTDGALVFCIYDAKYYVPDTAKNIKSQPGVESITKQFLYQSAYRKFIADHDFQEVINAFLVPTARDEASMLARVSFPNVIADEKLPFNNRVDMWGLPASEVFAAYLKGERIDGEQFRGIWDNHLYGQY